LPSAVAGTQIAGCLEFAALAAKHRWACRSGTLSEITFRLGKERR
jgi:hypothetical protein